MSGTANLSFSNYRIEGGNLALPSVIVGVDPWDSADSANYTETWSSADAATSVAPAAVADFAGISIDGNLSGLNMIVHAVLTNLAGATGTDFMVILRDKDGDDVAILSDALGPDIRIIEASGLDEEVAVDFIGDPINPTTTAEMSPAGLTDLFQAGGSVAIRRTPGQGAVAPYDHGLRITWVEFAIAWVDPPPPPPSPAGTGGISVGSGGTNTHFRFSIGRTKDCG